MFHPKDLAIYNVTPDELSTFYIRSVWGRSYRTEEQEALDNAYDEANGLQDYQEETDARDLDYVKYRLRLIPAGADVIVVNNWKKKWLETMIHNRIRIIDVDIESLLDLDIEVELCNYHSWSGAVGRRQCAVTITLLCHLWLCDAIQVKKIIFSKL